MKKYYKSLNVSNPSEVIYGMAQKKSDLADILEEPTAIIIEHLIKLYLYPSSQYVSHWKQEIFNFQNKVSKLKHSKKYPSAAFIYNNTYKINSKYIEKWMENIVEDYKLENIRPDRLNSREVKIKIEEYYRWLAANLSASGAIYRNSCYKKLDELFL